MADRITTDLNPDVTAPTVQVAQTPTRVGVTPSPISAFMEEVTPVRKALLKTLKKDVDSVTPIAQKIVTDFNDFATKTMAQIGDDYNPTMAQADMRIRLQQQLVDSNLPLEHWSKVRESINPLIDTVGKEHYLEKKGVHYSISGVTGEFRALIPPKGNAAEEIMVDTMSQLPPAMQAYLQTLPPQQQTDIVIGIGRLQTEAMADGFRNATLNYKMDALNFTEKQRELAAPAKKVALFDRLNQDFWAPLEKTMLFTVRNGGDPEAAFNAFRGQLLELFSTPENGRVLIDAGYKGGVAEYLKDMEPVLEIFREKLNANSQTKADVFEMTRLDVRGKLRMAHMRNELTDQELLFWEDSAKLQQLVMAMTYDEAFSKDLQVRFPTISSFMLKEQNAELQTQLNQSKLKNTDDVQAFKSVLADTVKQIKALQQGNTQFVHGPTLIRTYEQLKASPNWKKLSPEDAALIDQSIKNIQQTYQSYIKG